MASNPTAVTHGLGEGGWLSLDALEAKHKDDAALFASWLSGQRTPAHPYLHDTTTQDDRPHSQHDACLGIPARLAVYIHVALLVCTDVWPPQYCHSTANDAGM